MPRFMTEMPLPQAALGVTGADVDGNHAITDPLRRESETRAGLGVLESSRPGFLTVLLRALSAWGA